MYVNVIEIGDLGIGLFGLKSVKAQINTGKVRQENEQRNKENNRLRIS